MPLFGRAAPAKPAAPSVPEAVQEMRKTISQLERRQTLSEKGVQEQLALALRHKKAGNIKAAKFALKKKKLYQGEVDRMYGTIIQLEQQSMMLQAAVITANQVKAMATGAAAMKANLKAMGGIEAVEDVRLEIEEQHADMIDIGLALGGGIAEEMEYDDDLNAELAALMDEDADPAIAARQAAVAHARQQAAAIPDFPSIPEALPERAPAAAEAEDEMDRMLAMLA